jgi:hypothetical protein
MQTTQLLEGRKADSLVTVLYNRLLDTPELTAKDAAEIFFGYSYIYIKNVVQRINIDIQDTGKKISVIPAGNFRSIGGIVLTEDTKEARIEGAKRLNRIYWESVKDSGEFKIFERDRKVIYVQTLMLTSIDSIEDEHRVCFICVEDDKTGEIYCECIESDNIADTIEYFLSGEDPYIDQEVWNQRFPHLDLRVCITELNKFLNSANFPSPYKSAHSVGIERYDVDNGRDEYIRNKFEVLKFESFLARNEDLQDCWEPIVLEATHPTTGMPTEIEMLIVDLTKISRYPRFAVETRNNKPWLLIINGLDEYHFVEITEVQHELLKHFQDKKNGLTDRSKSLRDRETMRRNFGNFMKYLQERGLKIKPETGSISDSRLAFPAPIPQKNVTSRK